MLRRPLAENSEFVSALICRPDYASYEGLTGQAEVTGLSAGCHLAVLATLFPNSGLHR
jgi:hypothetical protein